MDKGAFPYSPLGFDPEALPKKVIKGASRIAARRVEGGLELALVRESYSYTEERMVPAGFQTEVYRVPRPVADGLEFLSLPVNEPLKPLETKAYPGIAPLALAKPILRVPRYAALGVGAGAVAEGLQLAYQALAPRLGLPPMSPDGMQIGAVLSIGAGGLTWVLVKSGVDKQMDNAFANYTVQKLRTIDSFLEPYQVANALEALELARKVPVHEGIIDDPKDHKGLLYAMPLTHEIVKPISVPPGQIKVGGVEYSAREYAQLKALQNDGHAIERWNGQTGHIMRRLPEPRVLRTV